MPGTRSRAKPLPLPRLSSESRIVLQYGLMFLLGLLLLDIRTA